MTVSSTTNRAEHNGDGSTATFAFNVYFLKDADLKVYIRDALGTETLKTITTHYTVSGAGNPAGGSVTFTGGNIPASGEKVVIIRDPDLLQQTDYTTNDEFPAETHEQALDKLTMVTQRLKERQDRSIELGETDTSGTGVYDMGSNRLANVDDPVNDQDAATKAWVAAQASLGLVDGSVTGAKIADSTIGNSKLGFMAQNTLKGRLSSGSGNPENLSAKQALNLLASGGNPVTGLKNKIINGNFDVWQNGTSFSPITAGEYGPDRWLHNRNGSGATVNITRQAFTPGQNYVRGEPEYFIRFDQTIAGAGATFTTIEQHIEDVRTLSGKRVTVLFWAKSAAGGEALNMTLFQFLGSGGSPSTAVPYNLGNTTLTTSWQEVRLTTTLSDLDGKTLGTDGNDAIFLTFYLPSNTTKTIDIARASMVEGDWTSMPNVDLFEDRTPWEEFLLCQRYNQYLDGFKFRGVVTSASTVAMVADHVVPMRASPSITLLNSSPQVQHGSLSTGSGSTITSSAGGAYSTRITLDGFGGLTTGRGAFGENATDWVRLRAEL